jgi:hypothetical protein
MFVGDAARTCDPLTGEGIDQAMRSARDCALALDHAIRRGRKPVGLGRAIARFNPRLGQDSGMMARLGNDLLTRRSSKVAGSSKASGRATPLFSAAREMLTAEVSYPSMADTAAGELATRLGFSELLSALDDRIRDLVRSDLMLASELLHRELCAGMGPAGALTLFASQAACGGDADERAVDGAMAVELLRVFPRILCRVTLARDSRTTANNAVAIMTGDFGMSRATAAAARLGAGITELLADGIEAASEAAGLFARHPFAADRPVWRYFEWARLTTGTSLALAARIGARLAEADHVRVDCLAVASESLGIGAQICDDVLALVRDDLVRGSGPRRVLEEGHLSLPVLLAVARDPELAVLLGAGQRSAQWDRAVELIKQGPGLRRAGGIGRRYTDRAKHAVVNLTGDDSPLAVTCDLPGFCLAPFDLVSPSVPHTGPTSGDGVLRLAS